jgi:opacity protein-like surface antigen
MKKFVICSILTSLAVGSVALAGETVYAPSKEMKEIIPIPEPCIPDSEWTIDLFGAYAMTASDQERILGDHAWGGGVGVNYFFARYFGVGVEGMVLEPRQERDLVGSAAVNLFVRYPMGCFAPYVFLGGGAVFNADDVDRRGRFFDDDGNGIGLDRSGDDALLEGHAGIGAEYRITRNIGIFVDARYTFVDKAKNNYGMGRTGIRIAF